MITVWQFRHAWQVSLACLVAMGWSGLSSGSDDLVADARGSTAEPSAAVASESSAGAAAESDSAAVRAEDALSPDALKFFETRIRPVLVEHCLQCHSADAQGTRGGLSLNRREGARAGGESGPAVVPGRLEESLLWQAINYRDLQMPPTQQLPREIIDDFRVWIEMGAPDPRGSTSAPVRSRISGEDIERGRSFWSFRPPVAPAIPASGEGWAVTEIDRFVQEQMVRHELQPASDTEPHTLLRRLHADLVGLPPQPQQMDRFAEAWAADPAAAIAEEADRLLALPQFGERWARHWLDVARYAESSGREVNVTFPHAWRYRDYVIDAFNMDKPYDEFIREQVAGDLLPAETDAEWAEHLTATGFLALGPKALIERNPRQFQADLIDEQIDTVTRVVLGISVACARCHDHKFDPIPQTDYYALAGIFSSTETYYGGVRSQRNRQPANLIILPADDPGPAEKALSKTELAALRAELDEAEREYLEARRAARQAMTARATNAGDARPVRPLLNPILLDQRVAQLTSRINSVSEDGKPLTFCMGVQASDRPVNARLLVRGEIDQPAQEVSRGFVQVLCREPSAISPDSRISPDARISPDSDGRLELARWLTARENPLTARVMVNRIWLHLLGEAIVREPENFGASGPGPTHPELLDYLSVQFMESGWSVKHVIRMIVNSRVYRLSSQHDEARFQRDPDNLWFSRASSRRLAAETIRDAILSISGQIDLRRPRASMIAESGNTLIGPNGPVPIRIPGTAPGVRPGPADRRKNFAARLRARAGFASPMDAAVYYRSVYLPVARDALPRVLDVFDFAEPSMVIGQRESSNTPAQALYLLNSQFVIDQSDALARRLIREAKTQPDRIELAFRLVLGRSATTAEVRSSSQYLRRAESAATADAKTERAFAALSTFCQALFASAEFRYLN